MRGFASQHGFTLAEVLVALSIASAITAVAIPEFSKMLASMRLRSAVSAMSSALHLTRSEAIRRNSHVVACKSADGLACTKLGDWSQGWIVFFDPNHNAQVDANEKVLYQENAINASIRMWGNTHVKDYISYTSFGRAYKVNNSFQAGSFFVCGRISPSVGSRIVVDKSGTPRVDKFSC